VSRVLNTVALVGLAATAALTWIASRNARAQSARDLNRWENEGENTMPEGSEAGVNAAAQPAAQPAFD
jgi:hypothetical protein